MDMSQYIPEKTWQDCLVNKKVRLRRKNPDRIHFLIEAAINRIEVIDKLNIDELSVNVVFENHYSSLLELLHVYLLQKGYSVNNHICLAYYLRDELKDKELFNSFNNLRLDRNKLIYYGKQLSLGKAKINIEISKQLIERLKEIIKKNLK